MKSLFDEIAGTYDDWFRIHPRETDLELETIRAMGLQGRGLDVGCGTGMLSPPNCIGLDPSLPMLLRARTRMSVVRALAEHLPFRDQTFDFVIMTTSICFTRSPGLAMEEAERVLREGGHQVVCMIPRDSAWGRYYRRKGEQGHPVYSRAGFLDVKDVLEMVGMTGMVVDRTASCLHDPPGHSAIDDRVMVDDTHGGFVCIRAVKGIR